MTGIAEYKQSVPEDIEQTLLISWAKYASAKYPELDMLIHIPNGGLRAASTGAALKRQGVRPGYPDLALNTAHCGYHGLFIELKRIGGRASDLQIDWLERLERAGNAVAVCWGMEPAQALLEAYLGDNAEDVKSRVLSSERGDFAALRQRKGRQKNADRD